jgi:hypothetical protein
MKTPAPSAVQKDFSTMRERMIGFVFCVAVFAIGADAQTVTGSEFTSSPLDTFTDPPYTMSHYGLTWGDFSGGTVGPSAMLSGYGGINLYTFGTRRLTITVGGNLGIGTSTPDHKLTVIDGEIASMGKTSGFRVFSGNGDDANGAPWYGLGLSTLNLSGNAAFAGLTTQLAGYYGLNFQTATGQMVMRSDNGYVGIGTMSPISMLDVAGQIHAAGGIVFPDGSTQNTAFNSTLCGGDYAEAVDVTGERHNYGPGDVLVIDPNSPGKFLKSAEPYSTAVLGVYSTKPGVLGRRQESQKNDDEVPMAMVGIVPTKVSAENGAIKPGDLLVSASTPGYAMKGTAPSRMLGAVIGKALGRLDSGTGTIEVGITLQ